MKLVVLESPYAGDVAANVEYARACVRDCLKRGEAPTASHLLFTQPGVLDDGIPSERALGIAAGYAWIARADAVVVYVDRGVSRGMRAGIVLARERGVEIEYRTIEGLTWTSGPWSAVERGAHTRGPVPEYRMLDADPDDVVVATTARGEVVFCETADGRPVSGLNV